jgi:hypothetical protein
MRVVFQTTCRQLRACSQNAAKQLPKTVSVASFSSSSLSFRVLSLLAVDCCRRTLRRSRLLLKTRSPEFTPYCVVATLHRHDIGAATAAGAHGHPERHQCLKLQTCLFRPNTSFESLRKFVPVGKPATYSTLAILSSAIGYITSEVAVAQHPCTSWRCGG